MGLAFRAFFIALFAVLKRWKIVIFFFVLTFFTSAFLAAPIFTSISSWAGHSGGLSEYLQAFDPEAAADFAHHNREMFQGFFLAAGMAGVLFYIFYHLLSGGMIVILADIREKTTLKTLFRGCGGFAFRYLRLLLYFCLLMGVLALINLCLDKLLLWYFTGYQEYGSGSGALGWILMIKNGFMALLLAIALVSFNYAKTAAVVDNRHFMAGALYHGLAFTLSHPFVTGLYFVLSTATLALPCFLYYYFSRWIDPERSYHFLDSLGGITMSGALITVILMQVVQFLVQACLVFRHAGQVYIYKFLTIRTTNPDPELAPREETLEDPYANKPFIPDSPYRGPDKTGKDPDVEDPIHD
jgi:hypothetical protein